MTYSDSHYFFFYQFKVDDLFVYYFQFFVQIVDIFMYS